MFAEIYITISLFIAIYFRFFYDGSMSLLEPPEIKESIPKNKILNLKLYTNEELKQMEIAEKKKSTHKICGWKLGKMSQEELNKLYD